MEYVLAVLTGIVFGGIVGVCKYLFIWKGLLHPKNPDALTNRQTYGRIFISYLVNVATLLTVYFVRNIIPFDFVAFAIATAFALSLAGRGASFRKSSKPADGYEETKEM